MNSRIAMMRVFNYIAFQVCWFALLLFGNLGVVVFGLFLLIHLILVYYLDSFNSLKLEFATIFVVSMIGIVTDSLLLKLNIYNFAGLDFLPPWYIAMWLLLSTTFNHCFYLFLKLPVIVLVFVGATTVPIIYFGASKTTEMFSLVEPLAMSLGSIALVWAILMPLFIKITLLLQKQFIHKKIESKLY